MEIQNSTAQGMAAAPLSQSAPAPAQPDGRAAADAVASAKDPRPDVPLPIPASTSQSGLVSRSALADKDAAPKLDDAGVSSAERMLKPYGITMLPEKQDAPKQEVPPEA